MDSFPTNASALINDGILVHEGRVIMKGNEISGFAGRGIVFEDADVDTFINEAHDPVTAIRESHPAIARHFALKGIYPTC
jgi:hypothetical protein